jgi:hypothetical protein
LGTRKNETQGKALAANFQLLSMNAPCDEDKEKENRNRMLTLSIGRLGRKATENGIHR